MSSASSNRTLIGNWVEEAALAAFDGSSTAHRTMIHTQGQTDWKSTQRANYTFDYNQKVTTRTATNNAALQGRPRAQLNERRFREEAIRLVKEKKEREAAELAAQQKTEWLDARPSATTKLSATVKSTGADAESGDGAEQSRPAYKWKLDAQPNAISIYSTGPLEVGVSIKENFPHRPFDKTTSFSKPLAEYVDGEGEDR